MNQKAKPFCIPTEIEKQIKEDVREFLKDRDWHKYNPNGIYVMTTLMTEMMKYVHQTFSETYAHKEDVNPVFYHFMLSVLLDFMSEMQTYISEVKLWFKILNVNIVYLRTKRVEIITHKYIL